MGEPWCLWGAEQGRIRHTACQGVGGPLPAVGASHGVVWDWEGLVGVGVAGGREKPRQALRARRLRHAERTVLPAVAQM